MSDVGDGIKSDRAAWTFGGDTPKMFDEHVSKSVPLYNEGHNLICDISDFFVKNDSFVYEIGCSTGTLIRKLASHNKNKKNAKFIGIDIEQKMIDYARMRSSEDEFKDLNLEYISNDVLGIEMEKTDMIVCYYTVQFIRPAVRQDIINKLYERLNWGGALLLFEKVRGADARFQDIITALYTDYKIRVGYSSEDIVAKSRSLKGILEPFSTQGNIDLLNRAGFEDINTIQKYLCFEGFLAIK